MKAGMTMPQSIMGWSMDLAARAVMTATVLLPMVFGGGGGYSESDGPMNNVVITSSYSVTNANYILQRVNGRWDAMDEGFSPPVGVDFIWSIAKGLTGIIYASVENVYVGEGADDPCIYAWDGLSWTALAGGALNGSIRKIIVKPDGNLLVVGTFTATAAAAPLKYVALYDVTNDTWSAVGDGLNSFAYDAAQAPNGDIYITGAFTALDGGTPGDYNYVIKLAADGATYSALGTGLDDEGRVIAIDVDGYPIVGGKFANANGVACARIAKWNGTTFTPYGAGMAAATGTIQCQAIAVSPSGLVFAGAYHDGTEPTIGGLATKIAYWDPSESDWKMMQDGINTDGVANQVYSIVNLRGDGVMVGTDCPTINGLSILDCVANWNKNAWSAEDVDLPGDSYVSAIFYDQETDRVILGFTTAGTAIVAGSPSADANNAGTADAFPVIKINRSGGTSATLVSIRNLTTNQALLFNWEMQDGEEITIDLRGTKKRIDSSITSSQLGKIMPNSNFSTFRLKPGVNDISLYVIGAGDPTITAYIQWESEFLNVDGAAA